MFIAPSLINHAVSFTRQIEMGFNTGIIGLPNAGKFTIFNALTGAEAQTAGYPFTTIDPNNGVVAVSDERLFEIAKITNPEKITPASMEFVDVEGLVKGASTGEGLGNQFFGHIRSLIALLHVVRCFTDKFIIHLDAQFLSQNKFDQLYGKTPD